MEPGGVCKPMLNLLNWADRMSTAKYEFWCLEEDQSLAQNQTSPPWALEIISPAMKPVAWRNTIETTIGWLQGEYEITGDDNCSTHVHISKRQPYTIDELKLVAQAAIYWEPAWEAVVPEDRRGNRYARSNYIDNPRFTEPGRTDQEIISNSTVTSNIQQPSSRDEAIDRIGATTNEQELLNLMNPVEADVNNRRHWAFNFMNVQGGCRTIEFRRGAHSRSTDDVRMWISAATCFVLAAIRAGSVDVVRTRRCHGWGLQRFMHEAMLATGRRRELSTNGMFRENDIAPLFNGAQGTKKPTPNKTIAHSGDMLERVRQMTLNDEPR